MDKVSIVIPVYGQWHLLKRNIDSLIKFDKDLIHEIIFVNDCSPEKNPYVFDDSIVKEVLNITNKGYAGTVNVGLKKASSDIVVLLDSDAYPIESFIRKVIDAFRKNKRLGCIGFATVDDEGSPVGNFRYEPNVYGLMLGQKLEAKLSFLNGKKGNLLPYSCAVAFRKKCLEDMEYLDEINFPVLDADHDISMRIHRSNWILKYDSDITVSHKGGNSYQINYKRVLLFYNSRWRLLKKHNKLGVSSIVKKVILSRLYFEWVLLKGLLMVKPNNEMYKEKMEGRKIIINSVSFN
ncbi:MAG: glycosyltransferase family 2 protein [Sporocytophaga sp.]|uniref:glycosyltransferase family 2 protein n=1 Tax=Sporocytophaga sp. TaxID=2231183 RepID=UPI001B2BC855|nr:glycosyltransferase family 2 protein [Sporocytophaga sp.]MBO9699690.1 glycosyltransferase family 2 protein [Sporocytophaga sp.]